MPQAVSIDPNAVLWSAGEADRRGRPLLVLMHGYLSHEGDLFQLAPHLPLGPVIASLRAPIDMGQGFAWYPLDAPGDPSAEGVDAAARAVLAWLGTLDEEAAPQVGLLGFSQGGAMAVQLMRHAPERFAYVVQLSGYVSPGTLPGDEHLARLKPPVFWGRGTSDEVIPGHAVTYTNVWLPNHSTLAARIYEGVGHGISEQELKDVAAFISANLPV
ncbi:alpha/beta hydrolase [Homoserinimonas sp. OAct 916]|uniref:alpha/beta hydrolase n=1 Tax=Homoserinimonas sp. OAct 916 TaxID=2211450 RepID=UPI000DBE060E|nr:alpha/beta hydrolase-fold protein [Homoserinimonas sp. OAct 916]